MKIKISRMWTMAMGCALLALVAGCDDVKDEFDYVPSAGQGALIVENNTASDINLYVNGLSRGQVDDDSYLPVDASPGTYRVVLDEEDGDRSYGVDVDILEGRLTILRVYIDSGDYTDYNVRIEFE